MLQPARRKYRGVFTSAKLSGVAKRADELFEHQDPYATSNRANSSLPVKDQRTDAQIQSQEQLVRFDSVEKSINATYLQGSAEGYRVYASTPE